MKPETHHDQGTGGYSARIGIPLLGLLIIAAVSVALVSLVEQRTRERIAINEASRSLKAIQATLPAAGFDNQPHQDKKMVSAAEYLGTKKLLPVYRARNGEQVVAVVLTVVAPDGYVAPIKLLTGIDGEGRIIAVRAIAHRETPGLGDAIDKDKSDWIDTFSGRLVSNASTELQLGKDGGDIDHITGATITSRAITNAVRKAARYYELNSSSLASDEADGIEP